MITSVLDTCVPPQIAPGRLAHLGGDRFQAVPAPRVVTVASAGRAARCLAAAPYLGIPEYRSGQVALIGCACPFGEVVRVAGGLEVVWPGAFATFS